MKKVISGFFGLILNAAVYIAVIIFVFRAASWGYDFAYEVFGDRAVSKYDNSEVVVEIRMGSTVKDVAKLLKGKGLIKYESAFTMRLRLEGDSVRIQPGTYYLSPSMTTEEIITEIAPENDGQDETDAARKWRTPDFEYA